ncbi:MAG: thioredoxin family protein [Gemmataceae bacterium]|jgi:peroxiredoxin|nr:thioredoxin family protein [Gemmataceae bacterium]
MLRSFLISLVFVSVLRAGEFNKVLSIGDAAPNWENLPATDGKQYSLKSFQNAEYLVIVFTCNSCPTAVDYEDRIIQFANKHKDKVAVVAINVNLIKEDSLEEMKKRAKEKKFPFVYLFDESQKIAKSFGATYTPEFFILNKERKVVYMGAMDDRNNATEVKVHYLEDAINSLQKGESPKVKETVARGCLIRYKRVRED